MEEKLLELQAINERLMKENAKLRKVLEKEKLKKKQKRSRSSHSLLSKVHFTRSRTKSLKTPSTPTVERDAEDSEGPREIAVVACGRENFQGNGESLGVRMPIKDKGNKEGGGAKSATLEDIEKSEMDQDKPEGEDQKTGKSPGSAAETQIDGNGKHEQVQPSAGSSTSNASFPKSRPKGSTTAAPNGTSRRYHLASRTKTFIPKYCKKRPFKKHAVDTTNDTPGWHCACKKSFRDQARLTEHLKYYNSDPKFPCDHCPLRFPRLTYLKSHMLTAHKVKMQDAKVGCADCGAIFIDKEAHKTHRRDYHARRYQGHDKEHGEDERFPLSKCVCGRDFKRKEELKKHILWYTNNEERNCTFCDSSFKTLAFLADHSRRIHKFELYDKGTVQCHNCGQIFRRKKELLRHMYKEHGIATKRRPRQLQDTNLSSSPAKPHGLQLSSDPSKQVEFPLKCLCGDTFPNRSKFYSHLYKMRPKIPFKCPHCPEEYALHYRLVEHVRNRHDREDFSGWGCTQCGTTWPSNVALWRHIASEHGKRKILRGK